MTDVLSVDCINFLNKLNQQFTPELDTLLEWRKDPVVGFSKATKKVRDGDWKCNPVPEEIADRTVEITGPPTPAKMVINAITAGANCYMADFEDSLSPTWNNILKGHQNLKNYLSDSLDYKNKLAQCDNPAVLMVRPRGLHMKESHMFNMPASLFDAGVYVFNCAYWLKAREEGIYLYLPKLEHSFEASWWNAVLEYMENELNLEKGCIKVTCLIETLPAVFQMDEILHCLKDRVVGLNCGRWDYIFSYIKTLGGDALPNRDQVGMTQPFLCAYSRHLIDVCHKRGVAAMGGMAAQIPIKGDEEANEIALEKVRNDKLLEVSRGHDGTWVAHPGLVELARNAFNATLNEVVGAHRLKIVDKNDITVDNLLERPKGTIDKEGLKKNLRVAMQYISAWLSGNGCVPINHLMEDAATAEISRTQVWQWHKEGVFGHAEILKELEQARLDMPPTVFTQQARDILEKIIFSSELEQFLTTPMYEQLLKNEEGGLI